MGHVGEFYAITCPSRMHARHSGSGERNSKYDGTTPNQAQKHLNQVWSRIRAKLKRDNLPIYGFRIAEPQHDGTPHWHLLLFMPPEQTARVRTIMQHYALQTDGDEPGAKIHRFNAQPPLIKAKAAPSVISPNTSQKTSTVTTWNMILTAAQYKKRLSGSKPERQPGASVNSSKLVAHQFQSGVNCAESTMHLKASYNKPRKQPIRANGGNSFS